MSKKINTKRRKTTVSAAGKPGKTGLPSPKAKSILRDANQFLMPTYKRQPIIFTHGRGCYVYDSRSKKYLDFLGGIAVNALGHAHPRIVKVIRREVRARDPSFESFSQLFSRSSGTQTCRNGPASIAFSSRIAARKPSKALSSSPGSMDALPPMPLALRLASTAFLALENSFHGRTFGAVSVTATEKYRLPFAPLVPGRRICPLQRRRRSRIQI